MTKVPHLILLPSNSKTNYLTCYKLLLLKIITKISLLIHYLLEKLIIINKKQLNYQFKCKYIFKKIFHLFFIYFIFNNIVVNCGSLVNNNNNNKLNISLFIHNNNVIGDNFTLNVNLHDKKYTINTTVTTSKPNVDTSTSMSSKFIGVNVNHSTKGKLLLF